MILRYLPNILTLLRLILALFCIYFVNVKTLWGYIYALIIFLFASLTDFYDGYLARLTNRITNLGKLLDPIADKVLVIGVFLSLSIIGEVNIWVVIAIMVREFIITGLRIFALTKNKVLCAQMWGKHKTVSQMLGVIILLIYLILKESSLCGFLERIIRLFIPWMLLYIIFITVFSGVYYLWINRKILS